MCAFILFDIGWIATWTWYKVTWGSLRKDVKCRILLILTLKGNMGFYSWTVGSCDGILERRTIGRICKLISGRRLGPARAQTWEVVLNLQNGVSMLAKLAISVFLLFLVPEL